MNGEQNIGILMETVNRLSRQSADILDTMHTDIDMALSVLAYSTAKIVMSQAYVRGADPQDEVDRFTDMLKLAAETLDDSTTFTMN